MSKKNKKPLVPELRFPEFRGAGEWEECQLGQCLTRHPEYGINAPAVPYSRDLPTYLRITDISEDGHFLQHQKVSVAKEVTDENYLNEGDIVVARTGASVGKAYKYREKDGRLVFAGFLIRIIPDSNKLLSELLFQFLSSEQYWRWVDFSSARSGQPGINGNEYASLPLLLPPALKEQQKIVNCLTSLDELITAEAGKLKAYKAHKKGLMQKLFPAEGETVPEWRFPEFRGKGEWMEKTIEQVAHYENGKAHEQLICEQGKYIVVNSKFISTDGEVKKYSDTANLLAKTGDILMVLSDVPNGRAIAKCFYVDKDNKYTVNQRICKLTPKNTDGLVLQYVINRNNYFLAFDDGVKQTNLKKADVLNCPIVLPDDRKEQQKIADCLSSLDNLITAQAQKIDALKAHKKGLMQGLFPTVDEVGA